jgi:long-subunit acyl-CoA synthetase (AMP-forming)
MAADSTARNLADRVDALAAALRDAGVPPEQSAGLLAAAARATMNAVLLDAVLADRAVKPPAGAAAEPADIVHLAA